MIKYSIKRLFNGFLALFGILFILFFLFRVLPKDQTNLLLGQRGDEFSKEQINKELGLDQTFSHQFLMYLNDLSPLSIHQVTNTKSTIYLDKEKYPTATKIITFSAGKVLVLKQPYLRKSYQNNRNVSEIIYSTLPETLILAAVSMLLASFFGILFGIVAALNKGNFWDKLCLFFTVFGMAGPSFFVGIIIAWVFGFLLTHYTGLNMTGSLFTQDDYGNGEFLDLKNIILPAITLGLRPLASITQLTRSAVLEILSKDYVRSAKAKGVTRFRMLFKHVLRNALSPLVSTISSWFVGLMTGAVFVEYIFGWKGIGKEVVDAIEKYDLPVVMGTVLVFSLIFILINLIVDILYAWLDPRIRLS